MSQDFILHRVGCCYMLLTAPTRFNNLRYPPDVALKVLRGQELVDAKLLRMKQGVYALEIAQQDAYGSLTINLHVSSVPNSGAELLHRSRLSLVTNLGLVQCAGESVE